MIRFYFKFQSSQEVCPVFKSQCDSQYLFYDLGLPTLRLSYCSASIIHRPIAQQMAASISILFWKYLGADDIPKDRHLNM